MVKMNRYNIKSHTLWFLPQAQQEKEYEERKEFISKCRLFNGWSTKFKHLLEMSLRKVVYPFDTHIMKQGDPANGLYFIVR